MTILSFVLTNNGTKSILEFVFLGLFVNLCLNICEMMLYYVYLLIGRTFKERFQVKLNIDIDDLVFLPFHLESKHRRSDNNLLSKPTFIVYLLAR